MGLGALAAVVLRAALTLRENASIIAGSEQRAVTDALSGLHNRRQLLSDLDAACHSGRPSTLAFFDLDGFKAYNDTFGHAAGDALLARLGAGLKPLVGSQSRAYRLGGDEFCVLLDNGAGQAHPTVLAAASAFV